MKFLNVLMLCAIAAFTSAAVMAQEIKEAADIVIPTVDIPEITIQEPAAIPAEIPMTETVDMVTTPTTEEIIKTEEVKPVIYPAIPSEAKPTAEEEETIIQLPAATTPEEMTEILEFTLPQETTPEAAPLAQ